MGFRAVSTFKDEYRLDYINVEEAVIRDKQELTERVVENEIVHNIKKFILTFGKPCATRATARRPTRRIITRDTPFKIHEGVHCSSSRGDVVV